MFVRSENENQTILSSASAVNVSSANKCIEESMKLISGENKRL